MNDEIIKEGFHQAVMFHGVAMLPRLRSMSDEERMKVMREAGEITLANPIHVNISGVKKHMVPSWGSKALTAGEVMALIVFGLWVHVGEREDAAIGLLADWPEIKQAMDLDAMGNETKG